MPPLFHQLERLERGAVPRNQGATLLDASTAAQRIGGGVQHVVEQFRNRAGGHVQAGIRGGVIDEYFAVPALDPAVAEDHVGDIADALRALRGDEITGWLVGDDPGALKFGEEE